MATETAPAPRKPRVVIVDDDRDTREMLKMALELDGYDVQPVSNGLRLLSTLHVDRPDLVLLDVWMSWVDGFELCQSIKKNEELAALPVVFLSGKKTPEDVRRAVAAGASDFFAKPVDLDRLLTRIRELVAAHQAQANAD